MKRISWSSAFCKGANKSWDHSRSAKGTDGGRKDEKDEAGTHKDDQLGVNLDRVMRSAPIHLVHEPSSRLMARVRSAGGIGRRGWSSAIPRAIFALASPSPITTAATAAFADVGVGCRSRRRGSGGGVC
jgi:hypothetical protein